jgi:hypothetical protein
MKPIEIHTWLIDRMMEMKGPKYCPPIRDEDPMESLRDDELRWREEVDAAACDLTFSATVDPSSLSTPVRYYLFWRLSGAAWSIYPLCHLDADLPLDHVLHGYLLEFWPTELLERHLQVAYAFHVQSLSDV